MATIFSYSVNKIHKPACYSVQLDTKLLNSALELKIVTFCVNGSYDIRAIKEYCDYGKA